MVPTIVQEALLGVPHFGGGFAVHTKPGSMQPHSFLGPVLGLGPSVQTGEITAGADSTCFSVVAFG